MTKLRVLDLFSGIGGFSLGLERTGGFETVAFCEYEPFPRAVLAKHWPDVPCFPDVRELKGSDIDGAVDVICGGYPCQPFSTAGQRRGKEDDRHLWPEFSRLVAELRPAWVIGENVAGHISMGLDDVLSDLEGQGYACRTFVIPACAVGAPHRRDRVWTVAFSDRGDGKSGAGERPRVWATPDRQGPDVDACGAGNQRAPLADAADARFSDRQRTGQPAHEAQGGTRMVSEPERRGAYVADANDAGLQGRSQAGHFGSKRSRRDEQFERRANLPRATWKPEPDVGRVAHGVPRRVDRLKALGNAVVPQIPEMIGRAILAAELEASQ